MSRVACKWCGEIHEGGPEFCLLVHDALEVLKSREPEWGVTLDRQAYVDDLVSEAIESRDKEGSTHD